MRIASNRQKKNYDHKAQAGGYNKGDAVWLHNPKRKKEFGPKLQCPWDGPYLVVRDVTYRIQRGTRSLPRMVHYNHLKLYCGENPPTWLKSSNEVKQLTEEAEMQITPATDVITLDDTEEMSQGHQEIPERGGAEEGILQR